MRYLLDPRYCLRGWDKLPFGLYDTARYRCDFFGKEQYKLLMRCDGMQEIDPAALPEEQCTWLSRMEQEGFIEKCGSGSMLEPRQLYRKFPCRYKSNVHWSITGRCNFRCRHCLVSAPHAKFGHPTTEQLLGLIGEMAECGISSVSITGGEPLIRKDFWRIVDALSDHGIGISLIFTNGYLVDDELLDGFEARGMHPAFQMSYDGVGWHDWLRGFEGAEAAADRAFALLQRRGYHVDAAMCLHKGNINTIRESVLHLASLGVRSLKVNRIQELGEWENSSEEIALTENESLQAYLDYIPHYFEDGAPLAISLDGAFRYDRDEPKLVIADYVRPCATDAESEKHLSCGVLKSSMYIGPDGTVCPCMSMADCRIKDWPNVFQTPLREILGETPFMERCSVTVGQVRDGNEECRRCPWIEKCTGGCRAAAIAVSSNYFSPEPAHCHFFKNGWYDRFKEVEEKELDRFLAAHPELAAEKKVLRAHM